MKSLTLSTLLLSACSSLLMFSTSSSTGDAFQAPSLVRFAGAENLVGCPTGTVVQGQAPEDSTYHDTCTITASTMYNIIPLGVMIARQPASFVTSLTRSSVAVGKVVGFRGIPSSRVTSLFPITSWAKMTITLRHMKFGANSGFEMIDVISPGSSITLSDNVFANGHLETGYNNLIAYGMRLMQTAFYEGTKLTIQNNNGTYFNKGKYTSLISFDRFYPTRDVQRPMIAVQQGSVFTISGNDVTMECLFPVSPGEKYNCYQSLVNLNSLSPQDGAKVFITNNKARSVNNSKTPFDGDGSTGVMIPAMAFSTKNSKPLIEPALLSITGNNFDVQLCGVLLLGGGIIAVTPTADWNGGDLTIANNTIGSRAQLPLLLRQMDTAVKYLATSTKALQYTIEGNTFLGSTEVRQEQILLDRFVTRDDLPGSLIIKSNLFPNIVPKTLRSTSSIMNIFRSKFGEGTKVHILENVINDLFGFFGEGYIVNNTVESPFIFCGNSVRGQIVDNTHSKTFEEAFHTRGIAFGTTAVQKAYREFYTYRCGCTGTNGAEADNNPGAWCKTQRYCSSFTQDIQPVISIRCPSDPVINDNAAYAHLLV